GRHRVRMEEALLRHGALLRSLREGHLRPLSARSPRERRREGHRRARVAADRGGAAVHRSRPGVRGARGRRARRTADPGRVGRAGACRGVVGTSMNPLRLSIKIHAARPIPRDELHPFIGVFHRFIQEAAVPGLLVDVADYAHVPDGPGVMLIGHDVDYGIDLGGGRAGLLTTRKRAGDDGLAELFRDTLAKALAAARAIEADPSVSVRFATDSLDIAFPDRRTAPNTAQAFELVSKELAPVARALFGEAAQFANIAGDDPRRMLALRVSGPAGD